MTMNPPHHLAMSRQMRLGPRVDALGGHLQLHSSVILEGDRTTRSRIYAEAGIAQYVIVNPPQDKAPGEDRSISP